MIYRANIELYKVELENAEQELLWFSFVFQEIKWFSCLFYRPPTNDLEGDIAFLQCLDMGYKYFEDNHFTNFMIMGDLNLPQIDWEHNMSVVSGSDYFSLLLLDFFIKKRLFQLINEPTRYRSNSSSILDVVVNNDNAILNINYLHPILKSDHVVIECEISHQTRNKNEKNIRHDYDFKNVNILEFEKALNNIILLDDNDLDINKYYSDIYKKY